MAAPMRNPPGGTIHPTPAIINFDTDDNSEWDIGVGDLIIDLDADIEKESDNMASATPLDTTQTSEQDHRATLDNKGLKMKIKRTKPGTKTCEAKHEIVKSAHQVSPVVSIQTSVNDGNGKNALQNGSIINMSGKRNIASSSTSSGSNSSSNSNNSASGNHKREKRESGGVVNTGPGPPEDVEMIPEPEETDAQTVPKKRKEETKDMLDVCVGTSVGTITEPDCLGPCEPGTSVTLEGIVWHETEGGVLVVNVTWRGKTYVGTLLDCTKHDWAPPRFCDSPTEELDSRTPKGRGKRGRGQTTAGNTSLLNDLSNFTETRSSVHSKLRNGGGGNKTTRRALTESPNISLPAPTKIDKRKNRFEEITESQAIVIPQVKKTKSAVSVNNHSPPSSPILLECPEPNCNKKYKHANGLKYHQSHAHGGEDKEEKNTISTSENDDSSNIDPPSPCGNITEKVVSIKKDEIIESCSPVKDESLQEMENVSPAPLNSFKVKPASALMPEDKKVNSNFKRRSTRSKSPTAQDDQPTSPAYSDISDDGNTSDKNKDTHMELDKKNTESMQFGIYPFFNQQQYVRPSEPVKNDDKISTENENAKREITPICEKAAEGSASQHYNYPFGYMTTGFQYGVESGFAIQPEDKEDHLVSTKTNNDSKSSPILMTNKSQILHKDNNKHSTIVRPQSPHNMSRDPPILQHAPVTHPHTSTIPNQGSTQNQSCNDNHQILKESIEMKEQMRAGFIYREEDVRRYYMYPDNRRKEPLESTPPKLQAPLPTHLVKPSKSPVPVKPPVNPSNPIKVEDFIKKEDSNTNKPQQKDGSKVNDNHPQYAYIHSGYLQSNPYAGLTFDSSHPVYRNMSPVLVPSPYGAGAYLHRFHNPEDLSRSQNQNPKALDLLQHANQFYPHKIHELQERALKSPTPKTNQPARDPIAVVQTNCSGDGTPGPDKTNAEKSKIEEGKEAPPPQHHVHTHHHTHVGLGYPIMAPQYPAPFGAGVNAAVNVINQFPPK